MYIIQVFSHTFKQWSRGIS